jgi:hypothetical protein
MNLRLLLSFTLGLCLVFAPFNDAYAKGSSGGKSSRASSYNKSYSKRAPVKGIYKFTASNGKQYIGKSVDVARRIKQHMNSGKLNKSDMGSLSTQSYNVSNKGLSVIEKAKIRTADIISKKGLANKQNAPFSRTKEKAIQVFNERKQKMKEKVGAILEKRQQ